MVEVRAKGVDKGLAYVIKCGADPRDVSEIASHGTAMLAFVVVVKVGSRCVGSVPSGHLLGHLEYTEVLFAQQFV